MAQTPAPEGFREYLVWTLLVAFLCFGLPFLFPAFVLLTFVWIGSIFVAIDRFERRGWWVLVGAPLALAWPSILALFVFSCRFGDCS